MIYSYEPCGTSTGVEKGGVDGYESFKIARFETLPGRQMRSKFGSQNQALMTRLMNAAHDALLTICESLSDALGHPPGRRFSDYHRDDQPSLSTLAMFCYPKQQPSSNGSGHNKHTDLGSLTFLLSEQWGLQVLSPDSNSWTFVEPSSEHAIINVGDTLRYLSGCQLKSAVHRVVKTGSSMTQARYSVAYFLRAEDQAEITDHTGGVASAKSWHDKKFDVFRQTHGEQEEHSLLTGGMEKGEALIV
jgi:isopenicillin N synthase-like dioxygenase